MIACDASSALNRMYRASCSFGQFLLAQAVVAKHQVVVRLQIFRIDCQHGLQNFHGFLIFALQEQNAPQSR